MINNVVLMGRIVHTPELKTTNSGVEVLSFTLAVERAYKSKENDEKQTDFIDCQAWRQTAVFISKYFNKGSMIALSGEIQTRNYEDKNGNKRKAVEVVANQVSFCGSKSDTTQNAPAAATVSSPIQNADGIVEDDDDLPF